METALDAIRQTALRERLQGEVVTSSRQAFDISEQRLREGTIDLVTVLQTQQTLFQAEDTPVQARLAHILAVVSLYQALGGGWLPKPVHVKPQMHGELPKVAAKPNKGRARRYVATALVLIAVGGALYYVFGQSTPQQQRRNRFAASGPVPVLAAAATHADVPVYLDAVGTVKALNTVTVRPQVDGKLIAVNFKEGQDVKKGDVLARIDPTIYQAQLDQARAKKAQDEALLANARNDLARYEKLAASNAINKQQADTQTRAGRAIYRAGAGRSGGDRKRAGDARLHQHRRADRRTHRHPHGRRRQYRSCLRQQFRHRGHHPAQADFGAVQSAAAEPDARQQRLRARAAGGRRAALRQQCRDRARHAHGGRQPGRFLDRHGQAQGRISPMPICGSGRASSSMCGC